MTKGFACRRNESLDQYGL